MLSEQARNVIDEFGGVYRFRDALAGAGLTLDRAAVYRWTYPAERRGSGGRVPLAHWPYIVAAAEAAEDVNSDAVIAHLLDGKTAHEFLFGLDD